MERKAFSYNQEEEKERQKPSFFDRHWENIYAYGASLFCMVFALAFGGLFSFQLPQTSISDVAYTASSPVAKFFQFDISHLAGKEGGDVAPKPPKPIIPAPEFVGEVVVSSTEFSAQAMVVRDVASGKLLYDYNGDDQRPIASITKLMSSLIILERDPDWTATTTVVMDDLVDNHMYGGDVYTQKELWDSALVASSNKAVFSLADAVGISRESFASRMNSKALELGMSNTHFVEPTGLDEENVSTATQLTKLLAASLEREEIQESLLMDEYNLYSNEREKAHHMWNTNWLLLGWIINDGHFEEFKGGKTGYIPAAGYNFSMRVADEQGNEIDVIVLGTQSHEARFEEARDIAGWVFENYQWPVQETKDDMSKI